MNWSDLLMNAGGVALAAYVIAYVMPQCRKENREETQRLSDLFTETNAKIRDHCDKECGEMRQEMIKARQEFTDTILHMLNKELSNERSGNRRQSN